MEKPLYVLRFDEAVWVPDSKLKKVKATVWVIVAILVLSSVIFEESLHHELSLTTRLMLIALCFGTCFIGSKKKMPSEMELRFYKDFLLLFRRKHFCSRNTCRQEYDCFYYSNVKEIQIISATNRINIFGVVEGTWYDYQKDGTLPVQPTYHKTTDSMRYFYTDFAKQIDFAREFEKHCAIVRVMNK